MTEKYILDVIYAISSASTFLILTEFRYSIRKTLTIMITLITIALISFNVLMRNGLDESTIAIYTLSLHYFDNDVHNVIYDYCISKPYS